MDGRNEDGTFAKGFSGNEATQFPAAYRPEMDDQISDWAADGIPNAQIARRLGINVRTFYYWLDPTSEWYKPTFAEAIEEGKKQLVGDFESGLFKLAKGFTRKVIDKKGQVVEIEEPPNVGALTLALKRLDPATWGDTSKVEHSGAIAFKNLSDADLLKATAAELAAYARGSSATGPDAPADEQGSGV